MFNMVFLRVIGRGGAAPAPIASPLHHKMLSSYAINKRYLVPQGSICKRVKFEFDLEVNLEQCMVVWFTATQVKLQIDLKDRFMNMLYSSLICIRIYYALLHNTLSILLIKVCLWKCSLLECLWNIPGTFAIITMM